jgi:hypothetical protein
MAFLLVWPPTTRAPPNGSRPNPGLSRRRFCKSLDTDDVLKTKITYYLTVIQVIRQRLVLGSKGEERQQPRVTVGGQTKGFVRQFLEEIPA